MNSYPKYTVMVVHKNDFLISKKEYRTNDYNYAFHMFDSLYYIWHNEVDNDAAYIDIIDNNTGEVIESTDF